MSIIYDEVKAGKPVSMKEFELVKNQLLASGAEVVILGCTELSIAKRDNHIEGVLDIIDVLARDCVMKCAKLRPEYKELIKEGK